MYYFLVIAAAILYTEWVGYWIHILLHSEKIPWLSRSHMLHHLRDYGPKRPLHREGQYINSSEGRANFFGVGLEWFLPAICIIIFTVIGLSLFGVVWQYQLLFVLTGSLWGHFLFGYMHSSMHIKNFWMMDIPILRGWYLSIRKLHDYHHLQISPDGRMLKNFGICFFWFDRILGSYSKNSEKFNQSGYEAALVRYKNILK